MSLRQYYLLTMNMPPQVVTRRYPTLHQLKWWCPMTRWPRRNRLETKLDRNHMPNLVKSPRRKYPRIRAPVLRFMLDYKTQTIHPAWCRRKYPRPCNRGLVGHPRRWTINLTNVQLGNDVMNVKRNQLVLLTQIVNLITTRSRKS